MPPSLLLRAGSVLAAAAIAVPVAACGSGSSSSSGNGGADPAHALPASAPLYVEARVRPSGDLKANLDVVARKLLRTNDPGQKITELIDKELQDRHASYKKDIEPWLGERAGVAVTGLTGSDNPAIAAIASKDDGKAKDFVNSHPGAVKRTYRGVEYRYDAKQKTAAAVVDHMVLVGDESGLKSAIDVNKGAARLADAKNFKEARSQVSSDAAGFLYLDPTRFFDAALASTGAQGAQQAQLLKGLIGGSGLRSIAAALEVDQNALRVDAAVIGVKAGKGSGDGPGAAADVPADAWLSVGIGDVGGKIQQALVQLGKSGGIPGMDPATLMSQLKSQLGVDVQKDFLSWMGDTAVFVRGTSLPQLGGAIVIHSKDPAASQRAVGTLRRLLPQTGAKAAPLHAGGLSGLRMPVGATGGEIDIAAKGDKFVIAYGRAALTAAFGGGQRLGDGDSYKTAQGLLGGEKASLFLDTPQVVQLIGSATNDQQGFAKAKPTLDAFGPAAAGASSSGDVLHIKVAVQVK